jgi:type II secretory pathway pseudopilin PulG
MSRLRHDHGGFALTELLIAMVLLLIVMGATLTTFEGFTKRHRNNERRIDNQDAARRALDHLQRQLRNLASPTGTTRSISLASSYDIIFQTADPSKRWVRYCLDPNDPNRAVGRASVWYQTQAGASATTTAPPTGGACPAATSASGWATKESVAQSVVNTRGTLTRPLFAYNWSPADEAAGDTSKITRIRSDAWVDTNPGRAPDETRLSSGVYLRNQNQLPVASFSVSRTGRVLVLNASNSTDPEGRTLSYYWFAGSGSIPATQLGVDDCDPNISPPSGQAKCIGTGAVFVYQVPASFGNSVQIRLQVWDPGGLSATAPTQTINLS